MPDAGAGAPEVHTVRDGRRILVRPLVESDRDALAAGFERLSAESRRRRFFNAPEHLTAPVLDYLTHLDYDNHYAIGAIAIDEPGQPGVGVARWVRCDDDPARAEPAVTVLDEYQRLGIGTTLMSVLAARALERGVTVFVAKVLWENEAWLDSLRAMGARVGPDEPGVASIEFDLVAHPQVRRTLLHRFIRAFATLLDRPDP
jgi:GNAT superfamily N-acetyltransferase